MPQASRAFTTPPTIARVLRLHRRLFDSPGCILMPASSCIFLGEIGPTIQREGFVPGTFTTQVFSSFGQSPDGHELLGLSSANGIHPVQTLPVQTCRATVRHLSRRRGLRLWIEAQCPLLGLPLIEIVANIYWPTRPGLSV